MTIKVNLLASAAALIGAADINPTTKSQLIQDVLALKDDAVDAVTTDAPAIEQTVGTVAEEVVDTTITHAVGPFAGLIVPAANALMERAGGSLVTAIAQLLGAAKNAGHKNPVAVVSSAPPASAPAAAVVASNVNAAPVQAAATVGDALSAVSSPN